MNLYHSISVISVYTFFCVPFSVYLYLNISKKRSLHTFPMSHGKKIVKPGYLLLKTNGIAAHWG